jgi:hypothetical protein
MSEHEPHLIVEQRLLSEIVQVSKLNRHQRREAGALLRILQGKDTVADYNTPRPGWHPEHGYEEHARAALTSPSRASSTISRAASRHGPFHVVHLACAVEQCRQPLARRRACW